MAHVFSKAECKKWVQDGMPAVNPQTNRRLDPEAEFGVYKELERQCIKNDVPLSKSKSTESVKSIKSLEKTENSGKTSGENSTKSSPKSSPKSSVKPKMDSSKSMDSINVEKVYKTKNSCSSSSSPLPVKGHILIIRRYVNPIYANMVKCITKHCASLGEEASDDIYELQKMMSEGFEEVKTLAALDAHVKDVEKMINEKKMKDFLNCVCMSCTDELMPFVAQYATIFAMGRENAMKIVEFIKEKKGIEKIEEIKEIEKRIEDLGRKLESMMQENKNKNKNKLVDRIIMPLVYLQSIKTLISIMYQKSQESIEKNGIPQK